MELTCTSDLSSIHPDVVGTGTRPQEIVGTKDSHFTIVPITNATGELVMVVIIFASK